MNPPPVSAELAGLYDLSGHGLEGPAVLSELLERERRFPNSTLDASRIVSTATRLDRSSSRRALDVGAGYGFYTKALIEARYLTTSLNPGEYENTAFRELIGTDPLPVMLNDYHSDEQFGVILMSQVLEHIPRPATAVKKVARLLGPSGTFACAVPNFRSWHVRLVGVRDNSCVWVPEHVNYFTHAGLRALLVNAGFVVEDHQYTTRIPPDSIAQRIPWAPKNLIVSAVHRGQQPFSRIVDTFGAGSYMTLYATH
jgi:SAM-dependent methyltransferase